MMNELTELEYAYLAGFFDGDGCVNIAKHTGPRCISPSYGLRLIFAQSDGPFLKYWQAKTGIGRVYERTQESNLSPTHPGYHWRINTREAEGLLRRIVDYVVLKRDQVQVALKFLDIPAGPWGSAGIPQDITRRREECKRALSKLKDTRFGGMDDVDLESLDCIPETDQLRLL
jgi:hypothetical protein